MTISLRSFAAVALAFIASLPVSRAADDRPLALATDGLRLEWTNAADGWHVKTASIRTAAGERSLGTPSGEYTVLFSATQPPGEGKPGPWRGHAEGFPEPVFKHTARMWRQATSAVALNTAGEATAFFPADAMRLPDGALRFHRQTAVADIEAQWSLSPQQPTDVLVTITLTARQTGYFSIGTPTLATVARADLAWAMVPGVFAGPRFEPDLVNAYGYAQGVPELPVLARERSASTLMALVTGRNGATTSVIAEPGTAADPWASDRNTRQTWRLGLSHLNRRGDLAPTLWHPVLGQDQSRLAVGEQRTFRFRYSLRGDGWFAALSHAAYDVYGMRDFLARRTTPSSLTTRLERLHRYVTDPELSHWMVKDFHGQQIGAQFYGTPGTRSGVVGSDADAIKNSDYGAMWMLAKLTGDPAVGRDRIPFARAFKLAQQQSEPGFFQGAAVGQYYLFKSQRFVEEWGDYVEPMALTYYTLSDLGNILLFNPQDTEARERLRLGADKLLSWQHPDGHWEVAYQRRTQAPEFTDLHDYRPTFYGLFIAWRILGNEKYLAAARRGADWLVENAVTPQRYLGVCGDARFAPDFATAQVAQALLDLADATGETRYRDAGIAAARFYATSVFTHPRPGTQPKKVGEATRADWEITQFGLSYEHGGTLGSVNNSGPILLASHAGLFIRVYQLTGDPLLRDMARAAALDREAFVDPATGVASYYWARMNAGAGPFPHHAWWQIGWITDYLVSEAALRSKGAIAFPRSFFTPKVGPHASYGFAPGQVYGTPAELAWGGAPGAGPEIDALRARSADGTREFVVLLNQTAHGLTATVDATAADAQLIRANGERSALAASGGKWTLALPAWGLAVIETRTTPGAHASR